MPRSSMRRLRMPLSPSAPSALPAPVQLIGDDAAHGSYVEFTSVSPAVRGRRHRYVWGTCAARPTNVGNALCKLDIEAGAVAATWHAPGCLPSEPVFVPRPGGQDEDDGAVLSVVMGADGRSFLLVLDGRTFAELARAHVPYAVPNRFHTSFAPMA
eukprot:359802-Chlamydomonas_euryale.AAC.3